MNVSHVYETMGNFSSTVQYYPHEVSYTSSYSTDLCTSIELIKKYKVSKSNVTKMRQKRMLFMAFYLYSGKYCTGGKEVDVDLMIMQK